MLILSTEGEITVNELLLQDKVALVTGGSAGMGKEIVRQYLQEGAYVLTVARRKEKLEQLAEELGHDARLFTLSADVSKKADVAKIFDFIRKQFALLDIVVNNAGIMDNMEPIADVTDELWERVMAVNLDGPFMICREAVRLMLTQESRGNIINIASGGGIGGGRSGASYVSSKFALVGLSKNIAYMYAPDGIRCNVICPGAVLTEIGHNAVYHPYGAKRVQEGVKNIRMGRPEEIADLAVYLASEKSSLINGATIIADGGKSAW